MTSFSGWFPCHRPSVAMQAQTGNTIWLRTGRCCLCSTDPRWSVATDVCMDWGVACYPMSAIEGLKAFVTSALFSELFLTAILSTVFEPEFPVGDITAIFRSVTNGILAWPCVLWVWSLVYCDVTIITSTIYCRLSWSSWTAIGKCYHCDCSLCLYCGSQVLWWWWHLLPLEY